MRPRGNLHLTKPDNHEAAIIFDLGGVLIDWNPRHLYRKLFAGDEEAMEAFLTDVCSQEWNVKQDAGRLFSEAVDELLSRHPEQEPLIRAWVERWPETMGGAIEPTVAILAELKKTNYPLYALSNWSDETFHHAWEQFEFLRWFDDIVISGRVKVVKPDRRIFALILEIINRPAEQCIFIDDSEMNITAARELGFRAIHYQNPLMLRSALTQMGILS